MADWTEEQPEEVSQPDPVEPAPVVPITIEQHAVNAGLLDSCKTCSGQGKVLIKFRLGGRVQASRKPIDCRRCGGTGKQVAWHLASIKAMRKWGHGQIVSLDQFTKALAALRAVRIGGGQRR